MRKLYEILKVLKVQKRIVSAETICGNTVCLLIRMFCCIFFLKDRQLGIISIYNIMFTILQSEVQRLTFLYFLLLIHLKLTSVEASQIKHYFFAAYFCIQYVYQKAIRKYMMKKLLYLQITSTKLRSVFFVSSEGDLSMHINSQMYCMYSMYSLNGQCCILTHTARP